MCPSANYEEIKRDNNEELKKVGKHFNSNLRHDDDSLINVTEFSKFIESGLHSNSELYQTTLFDKKIKEQIPCFLFHGEFPNQSSFIFPIYRDEFDIRLFTFYTIERDSSEFTNAVQDAVSLINRISDPYVNKIEQTHQADTITVTFKLKDQPNQTILFYTEPNGKHYNSLRAKKR